ncbi:DUF1385 domain-containing protein, partial [Ruminococcus sp.]|uniref:DUF1385 domain-containing protein n=1 Tax=Ruminococcus sp. TaxID=41978 RepID=UPI003AF73BB3
MSAPELFGIALKEHGIEDLSETVYVEILKVCFRLFVNTIFRVSWASILLRVVIKIALLPIVTGIAYELIRLAGKYDN